MAKAPKPKPKRKVRTKPKFTDKAESERFIEAARQLGIEETGEAFERAFKKIVPLRSTAKFPANHKNRDLANEKNGCTRVHCMFLCY